MTKTMVFASSSLQTIAETTFFMPPGAETIVKTLVFSTLDAETHVKTMFFTPFDAQQTLVKTTVFASPDAETTTKTTVFATPDVEMCEPGDCLSPVAEIRVLSVYYPRTQGQREATRRVSDLFANIMFAGGADTYVTQCRMLANASQNASCWQIRRKTKRSDRRGC